MTFNSKKYWEERYLNGGNSGQGSYGNLRDFKSKIINNLIQKYKLKSSIELGCGDGNQLSDFNFKKYIGLDVSETIIKKCENLYEDKKNISFFNYNDYTTDDKFDCSLSLDVLYHLIEDDVYEEYLDKLFSFSNKMVIIYSFSKRAENVRFNNHVKYRNVDEVVKKYSHNWNLIEHIVNDYPSYSADGEGSLSDFYIFLKNE